MGWAAGVERIQLAATEKPRRQAVTDLFVALATPEARVTGFTLAAEARRAGLAVQVELAGRSMKGQLKQAARLQAAHVAVVGGEHGIEVKDMVSGEQEPVESSSAAVAHILRGRSFT
jgi:histidyl-tRNA synthetase